jgi:hypothetical protein
MEITRRLSKSVECLEGILICASLAWEEERTLLESGCKLTLLPFLDYGCGKTRETDRKFEVFLRFFLVGYCFE